MAWQEVYYGKPVNTKEAPPLSVVVPGGVLFLFANSSTQGSENWKFYARLKIYPSVSDAPIQGEPIYRESTYLQLRNSRLITLDVNFEYTLVFEFAFYFDDLTLQIWHQV